MKTYINIRRKRWTSIHLSALNNYCVMMVQSIY